MSVGRCLEIDGISKRYGETVALQELRFDVRAGELLSGTPFVGEGGLQPVQVDGSMPET